MIRNIVNEKLQVNEVVLQVVVSSNLKIANERLEKLSEEVSNIKKNLEFTKKQLEDETKVIKTGIEILKKNLNETEKHLLDPDDIANKLIDLEERPRRNSLLIDGITETSNNSWENCEE